MLSLSRRSLPDIAGPALLAARGPRRRPTTGARWSEQMQYYYPMFADTPRFDYRRPYLSTEGNVLRGLRRR
jgi:hypothetical protein